MKSVPTMEITKFRVLCDDIVLEEAIRVYGPTGLSNMNPYSLMKRLTSWLADADQYRKIGPKSAKLLKSLQATGHIDFLQNGVRPDASRKAGEAMRYESTLTVKFPREKGPFNKKLTEPQSPKPISFKFNK